MVIVEGSDSSGKTTFVKKVLELFPSHYLISLKSLGPKSNYNEWMRILIQEPETLGHTISDRFLYSEYIYGPLKRSRINLTPHQQEVLHSLMVTTEPLVIRCRLIRQVELFSNRPQLFDWETAIQAEALYGELLGPESGAIQLNALDQASSWRALEHINHYLNHQLPEWIERRSKLSHGRGQMRRPDLMIVGMKFSTNNRWKVPFECSASAHMLHDALRTNSIPMEQIWFTNAFKEPGELTSTNLTLMEQELRLLEPRAVVGLGKKAGGLLRMVGLKDFHHMIHPGFFVRKNQKEEAATYYGEQFEWIKEFLGEDHAD